MRYLLFVLYFGISFNLNAQSAKFEKYNGNDTTLEVIDILKLDSILTSSKARLNYLAIFTNFCGGTHFLLSDINKYIDKFGTGINIILASSEPYKNIPDLKKTLIKYSIKVPKVYIIDGDKYKDNKKDNREKGTNFRNDICKECKEDIIGVPYSLVFDNKKRILFHGYRSKINFDSLLNRFIYP